MPCMQLALQPEQRRCVTVTVAAGKLCGGPGASVHRCTCSCGSLGRGRGGTSSVCSRVTAMESAQPSSVSMSFSHLTASGSEATASGIELSLMGALPMPPMRRLATSDVLRSIVTALPEGALGIPAAPAVDSRRTPRFAAACAAAACSWNSAGAVRPWRCIHCENTCSHAPHAAACSSPTVEPAGRTCTRTRKRKNECRAAAAAQASALMHR